jgi:chromosome segregation ATPase
MTKIIATDQKVFSIADALAAEGIEPTVILIQQRIGGSYSTVSNAFKRWIKQREESLRSAPPSELVARGESFIRSLWQAAETHADQTVQDARHAAAVKVQAAETALAHAEDQIHKLEDECESLKQQLAQAAASFERERVHATDQAQSRARAESEVDRCTNALQQAGLQAQQHLVRATALEGECTALKDQLSQLLHAVRTPGKRTRSGRSFSTLPAQS